MNNRRAPTIVLAMFLFGILGAARPANAASARAECLTMRSAILKHPVPFCVLLPPSYDTDKTRRFPIVYFFHGLGDNEQWLVRPGGWDVVQNLWDQQEIGDFLIATPAADSSFYINSHDGQVRYEDFLLREFMPEIEKRYRVKPGRPFHGVGGISMGGYGALHLAFQHPELFAVVAVNSAALMDRLPMVKAEDVRQVASLRLLGNVFGSPPDRAFWNRNNPLVMARTANISALKIYFDCGSDDGYGFNVGAGLLNKTLESRHIAHEFHIYPGGHDWQYFAEHMPQALIFESHALFAGAKAN
jgi:S-formylglutathione hydrolase FrmB